MKNKSITTTLALALILGATGCSNQAVDLKKLPSDSAQVAPSTSSTDILSMYRGTSVDVNLVDDPDLLTANSELIIEGEITGFSKGREWQFGGPDNDSSYSTVMAVKVSKVFKGSQNVSGETIFVENFLAPDVTVNELNQKMVGYECGLFLLGAATSGYDGLVDAEAGRPAGQPLWVSGAQTFVVQDKSKQQVVWPRLDEVRQGVLAEAMPGGSLAPLTE